MCGLLGCCFGAFFPSGADLFRARAFPFSPPSPGIFSSCCKGSAITRGSWWHDTGHLDAIAETDLGTAASAVGSIAWPKGVCATFVAFDIASNASPLNVTVESDLNFGWDTCGAEAVAAFHPNATAAEAEAARRTVKVRGAYLSFEQEFVAFCRRNKLLLLIAGASTAGAALFSFACNVYLMCYWKPDPKQTVAQAMSMLADALQQDISAGGRGAMAAARQEEEDEARRRRSARKERRKQKKRRRASGAGGGMMI